MPKLILKKPSQSFDISAAPGFSIKGYPLYASSNCVKLRHTPTASAEHITLAPFGNPWLSKRIQVIPARLPFAKPPKLDAPIAPKAQLSFTLDQTDKVFDYRLVIHNTAVACPKTEKTVICDLGQLQLAHLKQYQFVLQREFRQAPAGTVLRKEIKTSNPVEVVSASIGNGQKVYDKPAEVVITLNKPVRAAKDVSLRVVSGESIPVAYTLAGQKMTVRFGKELPRVAQLELSVGRIDGQDGSYLPDTYSLQFSTSGGPQVGGISIGTAGVRPGSSMTLTFDSSVLATQPVGNFIKVSANGADLPASISVKDNTVTISPALTNCMIFTVKVLDGLQNGAGVGGGSAWQYNSRTTCRQTLAIGSSVHGRSLTAYRFGSGDSKVIFVGTTHGNEKSSTYTLNSFVDYLETNFERLPANRTVIVIPNINPDGFAANTRTNAHNVDLNRNFPANSWKQGVTMPGGYFLEKGGGEAPLSEPESRALANYVTGQNPRLVLTYHATGSLVSANEEGDSRSLARDYGRKTGFASYGLEANNLFSHDVTGAFEDWLHDKYDIPALLVELTTQTYNEFSAQRSAMWAMVQLP